MSDILDKLDLSNIGFAHEAIIKLKLVHASGSSVFIPDQIFLSESNLWLQPTNFTAPALSFFEDDCITQFSVGFGATEVFMMYSTSKRHIGNCDDGAHLYYCRIYGPENMKPFSSGEYRLDSSGHPELLLFHHTKPEFLKLIKESKTLLGSSWNFQGTKKLVNVQYAYLTNLPKIESSLHLIQIGMASSGYVGLLLDDHNIDTGLVPLKVYREASANRNATLKAWVKSDLISPSHILKHSPAGDTVWYELSHPSIFRIGLVPKESLQYNNENLFSHPNKLKRFEYVIIGDATDPIGIQAPFNEEETKNTFKIEATPTLEPFMFWKQNQNSDLFSNKITEIQEIEDTDNY